MTDEPTTSGAAHKLRAELRAMRETIIWELLRSQWRWIALLLTISGLSFAGFVTYANAVRDAIDKAIVSHNKPLGPFIDTIIFASVLLVFIGVALRQTAGRIGFHIEYQVRVRLYDKLLSLHPRQLDKLATGQLMTRAVTDLSFLELFVVIIPTVGVTLILVSALAVIIIVQSPIMAILAVGSVPVNAWLVMRIRNRLLAMSWMSLHRRAEVTTSIDEAVRGIRVVKAFGREDHERGRVRATALRAYAIAINRVRLLARFELLLRALPAVFTALEVLLAGRLIVGGGYTIGRLLILLYFAQTLTQFAQSFSDIADAWQFARAGAQRITELLDAIPPPQPGAPLPLPSVATGLHLQDVSFEADGRALLTGLHLEARPGQLVVLHGKPGSGKTLTASIASGRVAPTSGTVVLDGVSLDDLDPLDVIRAVRVLGEDPFLFGRTLRENLEMGAAALDIDLSDDDLWAALAAAGADAFVRDLDSGLDAVLGDRGMTLSGGQRQRVALARALVVPPRVLVLDDALSAVNPSLELEIIRRVRDFAPNMSLLCITRREGLTDMADVVITLPDALAFDAHSLALRTEPAFARTPDTSANALIGSALSAMGGSLSPKLLQALATVPADRDEPAVTEADAISTEVRPTVKTVLGPLVRPLALASLFLLGVTLVNLIPQGLFKIAVDDFNKRTHAAADKAAFGIAAVAVVAGITNYGFKLAAARVNEGVLYVLRRRVFQRLSRLGVDYYDRELPGQVAARVVYDLDRISHFTDNGVYFLTVNVAVLLAAMGVILVWSPSVAAHVLPFVPLLFLFSIAQIPIADRAYDRQRARLGSVVERLQEDLAGRYVIDALGARGPARDAFHERAWALRAARRFSAIVSNTYIELMGGVGNLAGAALISTAGGLALAGHLSVGSMVALELYLLTALGPIAFLSDAMQRLMAARASFRTLRRPFDSPVLPPERADAQPCPPLDGHIRLEHVDFAYPGTTRVVLHDVSLDIPAGTSVAVVGPTGAGKSSIAKLVSRIYDPVEGIVEVDGNDLRDLDLVDYRRRLGVVPQDAFCFRGTVKENIAYGRPDATDEQIVTAISAARGEELLLGGSGRLWSSVEEEGRNLTAAQRQMIALSRALLIEPDVLLLDEATSSLDAESEEAVLEAVRQLGRTTIFITHRLPVAQAADLVVLVDEGRIVERGTHHDLLARGGAYARVWALGPDLDEEDPTAALGVTPTL